MSVEINIGDIIEFSNIQCTMLLHKAYAEKNFCTKDIGVDTSFTGTVILVHRDGRFGLGYLIVERRNTEFSRDYQTYLLNLDDLLASPSTLINSIKLHSTDDYPNKWTEFVDNDKRKIPERLTTTACIPLTKYERLIKKYVPLRKRIYLWVCNMWRNFVG